MPTTFRFVQSGTTYVPDQAYVSTDAAQRGAEDIQNALTNGFSDATVTAGSGTAETAASDYIPNQVVITASGEVGSNEVAAVRKEGTTYYYNGSYSNAGQTFSALANWNVETGSGNDTLIFAGNASTAGPATIAPASATLSGGAGNDTFTIGKAVDGGTHTFSQVTADGGAGNDTFTLRGYVDADLTLGNGRDTVDVSGMEAVSTTGGTATETQSPKVKIEDYTYGDDVIRVNSTLDLAALGTSLNKDGSLTTNGGTVSFGGNRVTLANTSTRVNAYFAGEDSTFLDAGEERNGVYMLGGDNAATADTLVGGIGSDTIVAGENDMVYGGQGNDTIYIGGRNTTVMLSAEGGRDVVAGNSTAGGLFVNSSTAGTALAPAVMLDQDSFEGLTVAGTNSGDVELSLGNGRLTIDHTLVTDTTTNTAKITGVMRNGDTAAARILSNTTTYSYSEADDSDVTAYFGQGTADSLQGTLDFGAYNVGNLLAVDLGETGNFGDVNAYTNIKNVTGSTRVDTVLVGDSNANVLQAGANVTTSLWGGAGTAGDTLEGLNGSRQDFYAGGGDGNDTIVNYNAADGDVIHTYGTLTSVTFSGSDANLNFADGNRITMQNAVTPGNVATVNFSTPAMGNDNAAKVQIGRQGTFTYADDVVAYYAESRGTLKVTDDAGSAKVWLDGSKGVSYDGITTIDARTSTANGLELAGGTAADTITAGQGDASIWGGAGNANDVLIGQRSGNTAFFFGKGEGNDVIRNSGAGDKVMLYNVSLADVAGADVSSSRATISLTDGSTLTIEGFGNGQNAANTFYLTDSTWTYNSENRQWEQK